MSSPNGLDNALSHVTLTIKMPSARALVKALGTSKAMPPATNWLARAMDSTVLECSSRWFQKTVLIGNLKRPLQAYASWLYRFQVWEGPGPEEALIQEDQTAPVEEVARLQSTLTTKTDEQAALQRGHDQTRAEVKCLQGQLDQARDAAAVPAGSHVPAVAMEALEAQLVGGRGATRTGDGEARAG